MTIRIVPFVALPTSRWKNGAGIKRDIAEGKLGDGRTGWTFGVADIEGDAPFSCFPDTDRWFLPVSAGLVFIIEGKGRLEHDGGSEPLAGYDSLLADGGHAERCTLVPAGEMAALIATVSA